MNRACRLAIWIALVFAVTVTASHAGDGEVTLIHIGDLHGHLVPRPDQRDGSPTRGLMAGGLAYVYTQIERIRAAHPQHLLINTGDTIQGSAEALFTRGDALLDLLNDWHIDAYVPGNWDFVYGTDRFRELFAGSSARANWTPLAANLYYATLYEYPESPYPQFAGQRVVAPYLVKTVGNVKVGIVGLTSDRGPQAVSTRVTDGFFFSPGEEELREAVTLLRGQEQVDLLVLISERGLAANLDLVERIAGVDVVLSSDMHEETREVLRAKSGTLLVEEGQDGTMVGELRVAVKNKKLARWHWTPHFINTRDHLANAAVAQKIETIRAPFIKGAAFLPHVNPISSAVLRTPIDTVIGHTKIALQRANFSNAQRMPAAIEGSSHDMLADAFKSGCNADVGMMRGFRYGTHIAPGPIKLEDIYHYIPIGPQIACGEMTGDQLRWQIEKSLDGVLSGWVGYWGGGWVNAYSGITYDLDPGNEYGLRVRNLRVNGELIDPPREYTVAGYWYVDDSNKINRAPALKIRVLKDQNGSTLDATDIVAFYLQTLPDKTVDPELNRIRLLNPLPKAISRNRELQPWRGVVRPDY
ncbi:MAG: 5'-nucleotidase C-terminal domain-containing protein [Gammaproteobacteria bacterium]|nr:5'-nucleotidase C-terminal domain-containing protein [Gammaproteobacteria bacterium]